jgi:hypothetical protein
MAGAARSGTAKPAAEQASTRACRAMAAAACVLTVLALLVGSCCGQGAQAAAVLRAVPPSRRRQQGVHPSCLLHSAQRSSARRQPMGRLFCFAGRLDGQLQQQVGGLAAGHR